MSRATRVPGFNLDFSSCRLHPTTYRGPFVASTKGSTVLNILGIKNMAHKEELFGTCKPIRMLSYVYGYKKDLWK